MSARLRSPKIPLSPSSPPETGFKRRRTPEASAKLPPSPPHMSVATKSYVSYGHTSHMDEAASRSSPRSPSSQSSYIRNSTQLDSQPYSTPDTTHSAVTGVNMADDSYHHRDKRQRRDEREGTAFHTDHSVLPTNHDRQKKEEDVLSPHVGDVEMQDSGAMSVLEQLDKDMGEPFLVGRSHVDPLKPDVQKHLLSLYGLNPLLQSVARFDPDSGEKINKLRKSFEGQIKSFQLAGRNKPMKHDPDSKEPSFRQKIGSAPWPAILETDEEWDSKHGQRKIAVSDDFRKKARQAMQMQPGKVRDEAKWDDVLGHEKPRPAVPVATAQSTAQRPNGLLRPPLMQSATELKRQTRGKKRSYGDDSFIGYGDGYSDGDDVNNDRDGEYGSDDGRSKKRRKNDSFSGSLTGR